MKLTFAILFILSGYFIGFAQTRDWPVAEKIPHQTIVHGDSVIDNYFWMRDKFSPEVVNYLYANNAHADAVMKPSLNLQKVLYDEFRARIKESFSSKPVKNKNYFYYSSITQDEDYAVAYRKKDSLTAKPQVVLDMNKLAKEYMYFNLAINALSPDQSMLAYGIDNRGNHLAQLFIRHIDGDSNLQNEKLPAMLGMVWGNDNKTIYYIVPETKTLRPWRVFKHTLGTDSTADEMIFEEPDKTYQVSLSLSTSKKYMFMTVTKTKSNEIYYWLADSAADKPKLFCKRQPDLRYSINHFGGNEFYILTNYKAPNEQLVKSPIEASNPTKWIPVIPHRNSVILGTYALTKKFLIWGETENMNMRTLIKNRNTGLIDTLYPRHDLGTMGFSLPQYNYDSSETLEYSCENMITPEETYSYNLLTREQKMTQYDTLNEPYDYTKYETRRLWAKSVDGTLVPMTLSFKKGLVLNGSNPTLVMGYGSYGASSFPGFSSSALSYMNRGFIIVQTHIRGGMELGQDWYEQGKMFNKKNTFFDFIACVEHLIKEKYTSPSKIAINGGSAGGLLMGAVVNMRPDLFKCVAANVPFVDVMNTMLDESIPLTTFEFEEWGNPKSKKSYDYMKSYSPYDNVTSKDYPDMLVTAGYNDAQVGYWEPAKWVSKMRELKTDTNMLLFKTNMEGGHGGASGRYSGLKESAFQMAFIMQSLGVKENYITLTGKVIDENNDPVVYATIYMDDGKTGTTSNMDGEFELKVKEFDKATINFKSVGFVKQQIKLDINTRTRNMVVKMKAENILMKAVVVNSNAKDPALAIIRETIKHRKENYDRVKTFSADVYMKSHVRLLEIPKKIPKFLTIGNDGEKIDSSKLGLVYLSESVAKYYFEKPDKVKEQMIASKVAGSKQGFSFNRVADVFISFYEPTVNLTYYSDRPFISPIAPLATFSYKYKFQGSFFVDGKEINKIEVIPLRKGDPLFSGSIYITSNDYQIYATDLRLTKDAGISFVDTVNIQQEMIMVNGILMPQQMKIFSYVKVFGFKATDVSMAGMSNYNVNTKYAKKFFNYEVFSIEKNANKKDTQYWTSTRTIILSEDEEKHYHKSDSIYAAHHTPAYLDSIDRISNKFKWHKLLTTGYTHYKRTDSTARYASMEGLPLAVGYNTVEGVSINYNLALSKYNKYTYKNRIFNPIIRYGFKNENLALGFYYFQSLRPSRRESISLRGGRFVEQINSSNPISSFINTGYTLLGQQNYMKLIQKDVLRATYRKELINGLYASVSGEYLIRQSMRNHADFSFKGDSLPVFTSNNPEKTFDNGPSFIKHQGAMYDITLRYVPKQFYEMLDGIKNVYPSKYPDIYVSFSHGIGITPIAYNYQLLEAGTGKDFDLKVLGTFSYDVNAGIFFNNRQMVFADYRHFNGNQTFFLHNPGNPNSIGNFTRTRLNSFHALNYYSFSTNKQYIEIHAKQNFRGFLLGKIPLLRKLKASEIAGINFLATPALTYNEVYVGLENLLQVFRVDAGKVTSSGGSNNWFFRIGLRL